MIDFKEFQGAVYRKELVECYGVDKITADGKKVCELQCVRLWKARDGIQTVMFLANAHKREAERVYVEHRGRMILLWSLAQN